MAKNVTIYDVAAHVGVSISTVSNALNRPERVSLATRTRVLRAADELGFRPKQEAVTLARREVGSIGVLATRDTRDFIVVHVADGAPVAVWR